MRTIKIIIGIILIITLTSCTLSAQSRLTIGISKDANSIEFNEFSKHLKTEI